MIILGGKKAYLKYRKYISLVFNYWPDKCVSLTMVGGLVGWAMVVGDMVGGMVGGQGYGREPVPS